jgi:hypothetical protein
LPLFHYIAEFLMATTTLVGVLGLWRGATWGRGGSLVGLGMFGYSAMNSLVGAVVNGRVQGIPMVVAAVAVLIAVPFLRHNGQPLDRLHTQRNEGFCTVALGHEFLKVAMRFSNSFILRPLFFGGLTLLAVVILVAGCLARPLGSIPEPLLGAWHGEATVRLPIVFVPEPDDDPTDDVVLPVALDLIIHDDGTVTGTVGDAELVDCVLKQNRGELGRRLNMATDYIIMDGYLAGSIVAEDEVPEKAFTIPFNIVDGQMRGSLFWVKEWKYPLPLMPRIVLVKDRDP